MEKASSVLVPTRVASWVVLIVLTISGVMYAPALAVVGVAACCAVLAAFEFCNLMRGIGWNARLWALAFSVGTAVIMSGHSGWDIVPEAVLVGVAVLLVISGLPYFLWTNPAQIAKMILAESMGFLYLGFTLSHIPWIVDDGDGRIWLLYGLIIVAATDTGAYVFGRLFGRRPLAPAISPSKTIEGAIGGWVSGVCVSVLMLKVFSFPIIHLHKIKGFRSIFQLVEIKFLYQQFQVYHQQIYHLVVILVLMFSLSINQKIILE